MRNLVVFVLSLSKNNFTMRAARTEREKGIGV